MYLPAKTFTARKKNKTFIVKNCNVKNQIVQQTHYRSCFKVIFIWENHLQSVKVNARSLVSGRGKYNLKVQNCNNQCIWSTPMTQPLIFITCRIFLLFFTFMGSVHSFHNLNHKLYREKHLKWSNPQRCSDNGSL